MKKHFLILIALLLLALPLYADVDTKDGTAITTATDMDGSSDAHDVCDGQTIKSGVDYCSGQSWNTFTHFRLDFDHTTDEKDACLSSGTETGAFTNAATATPSTVSPLSGGKAMLIDGDTHYIAFDNSTPYFQSQYGEFMFTMQLVADNANSLYILTYEGERYVDSIFVKLESVGTVSIEWEDNDGGYIIIVSIGGVDLDSYYGDWAQVHVKWDTTRCTDGDGNCDDANEDEFCGRMRVDDNRDGDFGDGGAEDWTAWDCEDSTTDLEVWASEPSTDEILPGLWSGTHDENIYIDDIEISYSQPSW